MYQDPTLFIERHVHFCIAGGYDERIPENVECYRELQEYADAIFKGESQKYVTFLRSISNEERIVLLKDSAVLLYTPANEHFGIVPLEGMYNGCVVFGCNSGGPTETIKHGETGYLLE